MVKMILIGRCCRISNLTRNVGFKSATSLFEWCWTDTLNEINTILKKLINGEEIKIVRKGENDYMVDTNIKTNHYINSDYSCIVNRRSKRLMDDIKQNKQVLFIRDDLLGTIQIPEIEEFIALIKSINPKLEFKILLLSKESEFSEINVNQVNHKIYDPNKYMEYISECFKNE